MARQIKILKTSSYGAGWSTWSQPDDVADFMLTYQPIIDYLEKKDAADEDNDLDENHPLILEMIQVIKKKFGEKIDPCVLGAKNLVVEECFLRSLGEMLGLKDYDGQEHFR